MRFGIADYRHFETINDEGTGEREIETTFNNDEWEGRLELTHSLGGASTGAFGFQLRDREFEAIGEEAFVPPTKTNQRAVFLFEQFAFDPVGLQVGARMEQQTTRAEGEGRERNDTGVSTSLGLIIEAAEAVSFVINGARSVKLPSAEELFSNGPHLATLQFELGDRDLGAEVGWSIDAGVRVQTAGVRAEASFFVNSFDDFIYQSFTGVEIGGLRVSRWAQTDAVFRGFEAQTDVEVFHAGEGHVVVDAFGDYVWAELTDPDRPLPRIPPLRFGAGAGYESPTVHGRIGLTRVTGQDRVTTFEDETDAYVMLDANVGFRLFRGRTVHDVVLSATNILDQEARSHTSFLKNFAPLPGRDIRVTYQVSF